MAVMELYGKHCSSCKHGDSFHGSSAVISVRSNITAAVLIISSDVVWMHKCEKQTTRQMKLLYFCFYVPLVSFQLQGIKSVMFQFEYRTSCFKVLRYEIVWYFFSYPGFTACRYVGMKDRQLSVGTVGDGDACCKHRVFILVGIQVGMGRIQL